LIADERVAAVERRLAELTEVVIMRGREIDRLREELDAELTQRAVEYLKDSARG
jgi:uncharacterized coiled-coil protein SlyX